MRIVHLLNHTGRYGGNVHAAIDLACGQAMAGDDVTVISGPGSFDDLLIEMGVRRIFLDQRRKPLVILKAVRFLRSYVREQSVDIIHAHMVTSALIGWSACRPLKIPVVATVHNGFQRSAVLMSVATRVIAVSEAVAKGLSKQGVSRSRLRTILNGTIGSPRCRETSNAGDKALPRPAIVFVGGLHPRKGILDLIEAFCKVRRLVPTASLHVVGEGPFSQRYRDAALSSEARDAIVFHGAAKDPLPWFRNADVFVCPSHDEPAALVLSEASGAGCAIVASEVGGSSEMLNWGRAGRLVPPKDPARLADAIVELVSSQTLLEAAKQRSRENAERLKLSRVVQQTREVYLECVTEKSTHKNVLVASRAT